MRKLAIGILLLSFTTVGCTGSFNLTKKVYNWHRAQEDKWIDELGFLVCVFVPVYGISTFADAIIFNSIEFWTGENPVAYKTDDKSRFVKAGDAQATISMGESKQIILQSAVNAKENPTIILEKTSEGVVAKDEAGNVLYTSVTDAAGNIAVYDGNDQLVKNISSKEAAIMKDVYLK